MLAATALVTAVPAYLIGLASWPSSVAGLLGSILVAILLSMALTKLGAALWMRHPLAREVLFADLMAWEWLRRRWVEHRLARVERALRPDGTAPRGTETLRRLASLLEARDGYTHRHSQRVARHAQRIARELDVPTAQAARIWTAATLHDIGKLYTPREILNKPDRLTEPEFDVIKCHPVDGAAILAGIGDPELVAIVRSHHERIDGTGYPDGLSGADIPLGARIIAVADTFDALTSTRPYRPAATHKRALDILRREAGAQLDAAAVTAFVRTYSGRRPAAWSALLVAAPQRAAAWIGEGAAGIASLAPGAGWFVPAAAAASAVLAFSSHVSDHPQRRSSDGAARVAAVRPAASSAAELVLPAPSGAPKGGGTARDDKRGQHTTRPRPQGSESGTPGDATLPAAVASSASTTPTTSAPTPTAGRLATAVRDVVGAVQGATPSVAGSVRAPRLAPVVKSVTAAVKSVRTTTTAVTAGTTPTIPAVTAEVAETASVVSATVAGLIEPFSASAP